MMTRIRTFLRETFAPTDTFFGGNADLLDA